MANDYTTKKLIESIKRKGSIPSNQQLFKTQDFLDLANDEMDSIIVPLLMSVKEEHFVSYVDLDLSTSSSVEIPSDAIGSKLREVSLQSGKDFYSLPRLDLDETSSSYQTGTGFYIQGNSIVIHPSQSGKVRLHYYKRPLQLVPSTEGGQIKSINTDTNEVTLSFVPAVWQSGDVLNAVQQVQPFAATNSSFTIVTTSSPAIIVDSIEGLKIGDWVTLQGKSVIPQLPIEAHNVLAQAVTVKCLEAMADNNGMANAQNKLKEVMASMLILLNPRVDGAPKKLVSGGRGILDYSRVLLRKF
jgi:hypothetical protein